MKHRKTFFRIVLSVFMALVFMTVSAQNPITHGSNNQQKSETQTSKTKKPKKEQHKKKQKITRQPRVESSNDYGYHTDYDEIEEVYGDPGFGHAKGPDFDYNSYSVKLHEAAINGDANAQSALAYFYYMGWGVPQNYEEAFKWYLAAANNGISDAQNGLGNMYFQGLGTSKNQAEAFKWYYRSAKQGNIYGMFSLANCYYYGRGTTEDEAEALKWYRRAADGGNTTARDFIRNNYRYK